MKKIPVLFVLFLLAALPVLSQVSFVNIPFDEALQRSKETGRLIFLQYEALGCRQCNEVADKAFENQKLGETLEQIFICIKITADHPDRAKVAALYNKNDNSFGSMFIASDGTLIHNYPKTTTNLTSYQEEVDKALTKAGEGMRVSALEKEYQSGNKSPGLMELLMKTKRTLNLETDSLLEEYVSLLPVDSLKSLRTLIFIIGMTPLLDSKADLQLRKGYELINKKKYPIRLPLHPDINNRIAHKSLQKAIAEKNEKYAYRVAEFTRSIYDNELEKGLKAFDSKIIEYYRETNDTVNYLIRSIYYYDKYYMTVSVDSIKMKDSLNIKALFAKHPPPKATNNGTTFTRQVKYSAIAHRFTWELNNAALSFYQMTDDPLHLTKALQWSTRANEFYESYEAMDTHAHLLYQTGKREEAIEWEIKAIASKKKKGFDTKKLEKELADMKAGKLKTN